MTKVHEWFWQFDVAWELLAFQGTGAQESERVVLQKRAGTLELKTNSESTPYPVSVVRPDVDVNVTWLLQQLSEKGQAQFGINRTAKSCHTPRRNDQVEAALRFFYSWYPLPPPPPPLSSSGTRGVVRSTPTSRAPSSPCTMVTAWI